MQRFIIIRLFYALIVLFAVSIIVFALARISGKPIDTMLPFTATDAQQDALRRVWGLERGRREMLEESIKRPVVTRGKS